MLALATHIKRPFVCVCAFEYQQINPNSMNLFIHSSFIEFSAENLSILMCWHKKLMCFIHWGIQNEMARIKREPNDLGMLKKANYRIIYIICVVTNSQKYEYKCQRKLVAGKQHEILTLRYLNIFIFWEADDLLLKIHIRKDILECLIQLFVTMKLCWMKMVFTQHK